MIDERNQVWKNDENGRGGIKTTLDLNLFQKQDNGQIQTCLFRFAWYEDRKHSLSTSISQSDVSSYSSVGISSAQSSRET